MSLPLALVGAWLAGRAAARLLPALSPWLAGAAAGMVLWRPLPGLAVLTGVVAWLARGRARRRRGEEERALEDVALLGELLLTGLTAGLSLRAALEEARGELPSPVGGEVEDLLRRAGRSGLAEALAGTGGRGRTLYLRLARAQVTGAPTEAAVASFVHEQRDLEHARRLEAARRLPVRLMIPLTLLILPGFAVLTAGPSLLASVRRLAGPLLSSLPPVVGRMPT